MVPVRLDHLERLFALFEQAAFIDLLELLQQVLSCLFL